MFGLNKTAAVYTPNGTNGDFTVLATSMACRLAFVQHGPGEAGDERGDVGSQRRLLWEAAYVMPDEAQVQIDGEKWNVVAGTYGAITGPNGSVVYRRCEVRRAV